MTEEEKGLEFIDDAVKTLLDIGYTPEEIYDQVRRSIAVFSIPADVWEAMWKSQQL